MSKLDAMYTNKKDEYATPQWLFDVLNKEFNFDLDASASPDNKKCDTYLGKDLIVDGESRDALGMENWNFDGSIKNVWLNPPYSLNKEFLARAYEESLKGLRVAILIPSRTDTRYWHDYCMKASEIRFVKGRLKFNEHEETNSAPFPSVVVIFDNENNDTIKVSSIVRKK